MRQDEWILHDCAYETVKMFRKKWFFFSGTSAPHTHTHTTQHAMARSFVNMGHSNATVKKEGRITKEFFPTAPTLLHRGLGGNHGSHDYVTLTWIFMESTLKLMKDS